jgi:hypothetical protein
MTLDWQTAKVLLKNDGVYPGDPQAYAIHRYNNDFDGNPAYHVAFSQRDVNSAVAGGYCHNLTLLWSRITGLTADGRAEMAAHGASQ